jgi:hypothetical protein
MFSAQPALRYIQSRPQVFWEHWQPGMLLRALSLTCAVACVGAVAGWAWANRYVQHRIFHELEGEEEEDVEDELDSLLDEPMPPVSGGVDGGSLSCVVCFERKRRVVCKPCRHFALCLECARRTWDTSGRCPCCRAELDGFSSVFLA